MQAEPFRETLLRPPPRRYGSRLLGRAASVFAKKETWTNGRTIRIHFADASPPQLVDDFKRFLREELPPLGLRFEYTDNRRLAHIRVALTPTPVECPPSARGPSTFPTRRRRWSWERGT